MKTFRIFTTIVFLASLSAGSVGLSSCAKQACPQLDQGSGQRGSVPKRSKTKSGLWGKKMKKHRGR